MEGRTAPHRPVAPGEGGADAGIVPALRCASASLLRWFARNGRSMAWRKTRDPYRIWVSEVMLQQTTVRAVAPYYQRFLARFPTLDALAGADEDEVLKAWEGLGYYARARNLLKAARELVQRHGGRLPSAVEELVALPGIGRSTAGAVAAIAFGKDEPILDANVRRVAARLAAVRGDARASSAERRLWEVSRALIVPGRGRETALALMDLGATVCTPRRPRCGACPLSASCAAHAAGLEERIPGRTASRPVPHRDYVAVVVSDAADRRLLVRRPVRGLLGGLWEFPGGPVETGEAPEAAARRHLEETAGLDAASIEGIGTVQHTYSHFRMTLHAFRASSRRRRHPPAGEGQRWVGRQDMASYALPAAHRKIAEAAGDPVPVHSPSKGTRRRRSKP